MCSANRSQIINGPSALLLHANSPRGGMGDAGGRSGTGGVEVVVGLLIGEGRRDGRMDVGGGGGEREG